MRYRLIACWNCRQIPNWGYSCEDKAERCWLSLSVGPPSTVCVSACLAVRVCGCVYVILFQLAGCVFNQLMERLAGRSSRSAAVGRSVNAAVLSVGCSSRLSVDDSAVNDTRSRWRAAVFSTASLAAFFVGDTTVFTSVFRVVHSPNSVGNAAFEKACRMAKNIFLNVTFFPI